MPGSEPKPTVSCDRFRLAIFPDVFGMVRHHLNAAIDRRGDIPEKLLDLRITLDLDQGIVGARHQTLAEKDLDPAFLAEQLFALAEDATVRAPKVDLALKRRRELHRPAVAPEVRIVSLVRPIVEDDEVAHPLPFEIGLPIELILVRLVGMPVRE